MKRIIYVLIIASCLLFFALIYFYVAYYRGDRLVVLDVGQGDSIFMSSDGYQVLVDGGVDKSVLSKLGKYMPVWDRKIELMVLTHPHADHVTGLVSVLERYEVEKVLLTGTFYESTIYEYFLQKINDENIKIVKPSDGLVFGKGDIVCRILYPREETALEDLDDINETSIVLQVFLGDKKILLMGDVGVETENKLVEMLGKLLRSDVLKVGHQGSITSSGERFLEVVKTEMAIISVGENSFGHPSMRVIKRLERAGAGVFRTDRDGDVVVK